MAKIAVIGGGTMGSGIAAACAAAGAEVVLLDATPELAEQGRARALSLAVDDQEHAGFEARLSAGCLDDRLDDLATCDWICEAVIEDLAIKRAIFSKIEAARRDGSVVSTNTSGIPLAALLDGAPDRLKQDMIVTHFFNPVRVMRLVELITSPSTQPVAEARLRDFLRNRLGKGVVDAKDTPNFIGNRIGIFFILCGLHVSAQFRSRGLSIEEIDAVLGKPIGLPPTALYGLADLIGLDVLDAIARNLEATLPDGDAGRAFAFLPEIERAMKERGQLGRKSGGGNTRVRKDAEGNKVKETFDPVAGEWRLSKTVTLDEAHADLATLFFAEDELGELVRAVLGGTLEYAADLVPEISNDVVNVDRALRWGFAWRWGPFELIDRIGPTRFIAHIRKQGRSLPNILAVLEQAGETQFYQNDTYLGVDGLRHRIVPE